MISHELKTPITAIRAAAQLMRRRGAYSEWMMDAIIAETDRLNERVDELLVALQLESAPVPLSLKPVDLNGLTDVSARTVQDRSGQHRLDLELPARPLIGQWDRSWLAMVLGHLLVNAIDYAPSGGVVHVRLEDRGDQAWLAVRDEGVGIPPSELPRVFDRFYRVDDLALWGRQGLGLGLYISRMLVEAHGGHLWAESAPGQGSTFFVTLPYQPTAQAGNGRDSHHIS